MITVIIDGREIQLGDQERLNAIQAAQRAGITIPFYCWHAGLSVVGSCRMCLVEVGSRDAKTGRVAMLPKLVPGCNTPVKDGTVIVTDSPHVRRARAMVEEDLLLRHPIDCPICDKAGECRLQDYHFRYGQEQRRADVQPFTSRRRDLGDNITLFVDRCILCSRCVRFTREISGTGELMVTDRGAHEEIDVLPGFPLDNNLSGNVVDLCPVGALGDKDFLYQQRVWFLRKHAGVCSGCSSGCSIWVEENQDRVWRLTPRENPHVNQWWICNEGRYGYSHVHSERRLVEPNRREGGSTTTLDWTALPAELSARLREPRPGRLAAVVSPHLTVEEAYLLCKLIRGIDPQALLALGPVPAAGEDEKFPNGFTIRAEKCPNRRGVERVIAHFSRGVMTLAELLGEVERGAVRGAWVSGGYKSDWIDAATAARFDALGLLIVQDLFPSPLSQRATYELPGAAFAEREGSYVNRADRLQSFRRAVRPPGGVRTEGSLYTELLGQPGLYNARAVLDEIAREILYFAVAAGPVPEVGLDLKLNLLAEPPGAARGSGVENIA
jgi:NADH-quinone oxidoreductase subunit G